MAHNNSVMYPATNHGVIMYRILFVFLSVALTSCASKPNDSATITGTRISKDQAQKLQLKEVGTIGDILRSQLEGVPQLKDGKTCKDLLSELLDNNFKIKSVTDKEVVAITTDNKSLKYTFNEGGCE